MRARLVALLGILAVSSRLAAGEGEDRAFELRIPELVHVEDLSDEASGKAFALLGSVTVGVEGLFSVRARRMVVWLDPAFDRTVFSLMRELRREPGKVPLWAVRAIYAEGGRTPAVFQTAGEIFRCSSLYYDLTAHRGQLLDAHLRLRRADEFGADLPDLLLRARTLRAKGPGEWHAEDVTLAATDYHAPQVVLEVEALVLRDPAVQEALGNLTRIAAGRPGADAAEAAEVLDQVDRAFRSPRAKELTMERITGRAYGVPFFRWKRLTLHGDETPPLRVELDAGGRGDLGDGARLGIGLATKPVAWMAGFGYYFDRGPLFDLEMETETERLTGRSFGVLLAGDRGTDRGIVPSADDRYWTRNQYRYRIDDAWRLDGELAGLSDATWLRTYDEGEFKEGKEQESLLYLRRRGTLAYHTLTGKVETIGFQPTLEEMPRYAYTLPVLTLFRFGASGVAQTAGRFEIANLRMRQADGSALADERSGRIDTDPELLLSFDMGPFRVVPFAGFRFTGYTEDAAGDSAGRFAGNAGVRIDTQLARWFGGTRHVVNLSLEYEDLYSVSEDPSALPQLDAVDRITPYEMLALRWRNRFHRRTPQGLREFLNFEVFGAWFPDGRQPLGATGDGFVELDLKWRPDDETLVSMEAELSADTWDLATGSLEGWWRAREGLFLFAGVRHLEGDSDIFTGSAEFEVETRWVVTLSGQLDLKQGDALDQELLVQRLGHTAVVGVRFKHDPGGGEFSFALTVDLLERFLQKRRRDRTRYRRFVTWN